MSRKKQLVRFELDSGDIRLLPDEEIKAILRAADGLIGMGGRNLLAKILKGSKDKRVLEHDLDQCPVYGYYKELTIQKITNRIDWMIKNWYFEIQYSGRLPMLVYSEKGWEIERETYAEELLQKLITLLDGQDYSFIASLKDRNRGMILLLIEKIKMTRNVRLVPILKLWKEIEYKKVKIEIQKAIDFLLKEGSFILR